MHHGMVILYQNVIILSISCKSANANTIFITTTFDYNNHNSRNFCVTMYTRYS